MKAKWIYLAIGFGLFIGFSGTGQIETTSEPINISNSNIVCVSSVDCGPTVVARDEEIYVVWTEDVDLDQSTLYFSRSVDAGETFSAPKPLEVSQGAQAKQPVLGLASNGNLMLAWADNRSGDFDILVSLSTDKGDTWEWDDTQDYLDLSDNLGDSLEPSLAVSTVGVFVVAWSDDTFDEALNPDGARNIFLRASFNPAQVDVGGELGENLLRTETMNVSQRIFSSIGSPATHPSIAIAPDDPLLGVFITWQQEGRQAEEIFFHQSAAFTPTNVSKSSDTDSLSPVIAARRLTDIFTRHQVIIAWVERIGSNTRIISNSAADAGLPLNPVSFSNTPFEVSIATESATAPALAVNEQGNFFIAWETRDVINRGPSSIKLRSLSSAFSPTIEVSTRESDLDRRVRNPAITVDDTYVYVVWVDEIRSTGEADVFFAKQLIRAFGL